jgi:hypothetical protein
VSSGILLARVQAAIMMVAAEARDRAPFTTTVVLATGDGNDENPFSSFVRAVKACLIQGVRVEIWAWRESCSAKYRELTALHPRERYELCFLDAHSSTIITHVRAPGEQRRASAAAPTVSGTSDPVFLMRSMPRDCRGSESCSDTDYRCDVDPARVAAGSDAAIPRHVADEPIRADDSRSKLPDPSTSSFSGQKRLHVFISATSDHTISAIENLSSAPNQRGDDDSLSCLLCDADLGPRIPYVTMNCGHCMCAVCARLVDYCPSCGIRIVAR